MHNFEKLIFWQKSILLAKQVYIVSQMIAESEKFGIISQMKRAFISIPSNIAEGAGRNSNKEFNHFLAIALGSAFELQTQLILAKELDLLSEESVLGLLEDVSEVQKMIYSFKNNLK
ncbi:four helix bundle protein [Elizabethkingia anophelis]|uniref:four helix bundle protein n=1 Tax=Elizabethkingia anophelis TaxID=1117645 RepID=UPI002226DA33|nr:four helix bundle protein [Elizabethkingia anophelis]MCW2463314.1 four helix bundle protein [Elizabethkingia anophelis]MCW2466999.1 four helix bundle protein [Elizabethkingia anophelis]MCW2470853.1 four helix bundle protein [Elizabethkingia anophelis]HBI9690724.1 four helix bundle protein [Elizabethkingia anophelis]HBI9694743.1 four helix bundle protein [Elizabethkingia anophelis]